MSSERFILYSRLKRKFLVRFKGCDLSKIIAVVLISHCYDHIIIPNLRLKELISKYRHLQVYSDLETDLALPNILMSYSTWDRQDYKEFVNSMSSLIPNTRVFRYEFIRGNTLSLYQQIFTIFQVLIIYHKDFSLRQLLYLSLEVIQIKSKIKWLNQLSSRINISAFIAFNSSVLEDSIVCSFLNSLKVKTYSLQHGFYVNYQQKIPMDIINYENIVAEKLLCWGNTSFKNLTSYGIDAERLEVVGNPVYSFDDGYKLIPPKFHRCIVLLGRDIHHVSNLELVKLLSELDLEYNIDFTIRLHPSLKLKGLDVDYLKWLPISNSENLLKDDLVSGRFDFAISNNTTAYFDAIASGLVCFRFTKDEIENLGVSGFEFNCKNEFIGLINSLKHSDEKSMERINIKTLEDTFHNNPRSQLAKIFFPHP